MGDAKGSTITLSGEVENVCQRARAEKVVSRVRGVTKLDNKIQIETKTKPTDDAMARTIGDRWKRNRITLSQRLIHSVGKGVAELLILSNIRERTPAMRTTASRHDQDQQVSTLRFFGPIGGRFVSLPRLRGTLRDPRLPSFTASRWMSCAEVAWILGATRPLILAGDG
ncbi:BON domain-containing protein [Rhodopirellula sp. P2]|uniref:BON domain-containing protein n=1 Tax=Rhodopirellula sp. P2 TaxID=2127060 RepID=UPI003FD1B642